ncbi:hypothetical protein L1987_20369 [Smallanthus sonchifolius]|uniref:Uncharacterized protein n=1 Tax=Smallanthus sonchifolius TaxID=185202 RepID=A0ACB9IUJ6_9ASTR|nr:hypothetical protein L1987_20369 [Smallanthus sonchifolius]
MPECFKRETDSQSSENGEGLQVLHYEVGQKYEPHYDYILDPFNTKNGGQRMATVLMYLGGSSSSGEQVRLGTHTQML